MTFQVDGILDLMRLLIGALAGMTACLTTIVLMHYRRMLRLGHRGIVPAHVVLGALTLIQTFVYVGFDAMSRVGLDYVTWRLPLAASILCTSMPAVFIVLRHVQRVDREMGP